jgi:membrane-anchored glycerophosphoryl diester phosphodiesterase (GDPDase)
MNISWHTLAPFIEQYIKNRREKQIEKRAYKRNQRKKRKYLLHQSILLKLIFSYHSKSLIENQIPLNTL